MSIPKYWLTLMIACTEAMIETDFAGLVKDWRPYLGPVKDQNGCGSCWAIAFTEYLEAGYNKKRWPNTS